MKRLIRAVVPAVLASVLAGCAAAPRVIPISASAEQPLAMRIADYPEAFQAITAVLSQELKLPIPRAALYLYPDREAFERGLVTELHFEPAQARESASFARGVGGPDKILANEAALVRVPWPARIQFLAHEFTHTIQYDLAKGRRSTSEQWLREGFADLVSYRVRDLLALDSFANLRERRLRQIRDVRDGSPFPLLSRLGTFPQWVALRSKQGAAATYGQAFLAVDLLVEQKGFPAAVEYFRLFARCDDRLANFRTAFGQELPAFEREFAAYFQRLRR
jgi:hypothetical protein